MSNENTRKPSTPHLPVSPGMRAKPIKAQLCLTEKEDKEQLAVAFAIVGGEHDGKTIGTYLFFTDATIETTFKAMRAMGWKGVDPTAVEELTEEVMLVIEHEKDERNGGTRARVRWVNAIGMVVAKPLQGSRMQQFKQRVGALAQRSAANDGATNAAKLPPVDGRNVPPPLDGDAPPWARG